MNHFVYLYRDKVGKPRYVGYGENSERALSHMTQTHNVTLAELLKNDKFKLEIAGPFESRETALAVETALISALKSDELANVPKGHEMHRFRPMGVPLAFAPRWDLSPLSREELDEILRAHNSLQFLCVLIKNIDFEDGRGTFDPANPPSDKDILERVRKWWPLRLKQQQWSEVPSQSPAILLAIHGKPGAQFVIGSVFIDRQNWHIASDGEVPVLETSGLDAAELRGRRIDYDAGLKFNQGGLIVFP